MRYGASRTLFRNLRIPGGGGALGISGRGCAAGTLEPLAYTRATVQLNFATLY